MAATRSLTDSHGLQEIRCRNCRKLIARGFLRSGHIEIMCSSCKCINSLRVVNPIPEPHDGLASEARHVPAFQSI